jgi:hypothetical protein
MMVHADIIYKLSFQLVAGCRSKNYKYKKKDHDICQLNSRSWLNTGTSLFLNPPLFIEVPVPSQESERSYVHFGIKFASLYKQNNTYTC